MTSSDFNLRLELPKDASIVDQMAIDVFGPEMYARAAYHLRQGVLAEPELSFVVEKQAEIVGTVRVTKIMWGEDVVLMLGPLVVLPPFAGIGIGRMLMQQAVSTARIGVKDGGPDLIMLVGDLSYYQPFGFTRIPHGQIILPKPTDRDRILACELVGGSLSKYSGSAIRHVEFC